MKKTEVLALLLEIRSEYDWIDTSEAEVQRMLEYLGDIPYKEARANVVQHIKTNPKRAPKIAEIRGEWGADKDHERLKAETAEILAERDQAHAAATLPPKGWKEDLYARLGKNTAE